METIDPLIAALHFFQSDANNRERTARIPYIALNHAMQSLGGDNQAAPYIDKERFEIRYNEDPILQGLVLGYDDAGVVLNTNALPQEEPTTAEKPLSDLANVAKKTANRRLKK